MGVKQGAKGLMQIDLTVEAPTVGEAGLLLSDAIDELLAKVKQRHLLFVHEA